MITDEASELNGQVGANSEEAVDEADDSPAAKRLRNSNAAAAATAATASYAAAAGADLYANMWAAPNVAPNVAPNIASSIKEEKVAAAQLSGAGLAAEIGHMSDILAATNSAQSSTSPNTFQYHHHATSDFPTAATAATTADLYDSSTALNHQLQNYAPSLSSSIGKF